VFEGVFYGTVARTYARVKIYDRGDSFRIFRSNHGYASVIRSEGARSVGGEVEPRGNERRRPSDGRLDDLPFERPDDWAWGAGGLPAVVEGRKL
jgi:hypothetical protein